MKILVVGSGGREHALIKSLKKNPEVETVYALPGNGGIAKDAVCIPIAAGVFVKLGLTLNPMLGAAAMSLSSFCVVTNALRLNLFKVHDPKHDKPGTPIDETAFRQTVEEIQKSMMKEEQTMTKTVKIDGMMCAHCEGRVKKALEALPGVEKAEPSHEKKAAVLTLSAPLDEAAVKAAVTDAGYDFLGIE